MTLTQTQITKPTFYFERFEWKYLLSRAEAERVLSDCLRNNLRWDPFVASRPGHSYPVTSVYLDTFGWKCYYEKIAGDRSRFKVRLRAYRPVLEEAPEIFLETKRKHDAVTMKERVLLVPGSERSLLDPCADRRSIAIRAGDENTRESILARVMRFSLAPKVLVTYTRQPLIGTFVDRLRVTFDSMLTAARYGAEGTLSPTPVLRDGVIMEVKYNGVLPYWFHRIIQAHNLSRVAFSKYCRSVEMLRERRLI